MTIIARHSYSAGASDPKARALQEALRENERLRALCERARIALPPLLSAYGYEDDAEDVLKYGRTTLAQLNEALKELDDVNKIELGRIAYEASVDYRVTVSNMARAEFALWDEVQPDNQECFSAMGKAVAKTLIAKMREAMGEEHIAVSYLRFQKFCPECHHADAVDHATACTRGRFFAALKEMDDA